MFTGLVEGMGEVIANSSNGVGNRLLIKASFENLKAGESIAVNGVCLTFLPEFETNLMFDVSFETLAKTNLGALQEGDVVNLERAMSMACRFGGHYVSGHVDTTSTVDSVKVVGDYLELTVGPFNSKALKYLLPKGSITLDGVSLTINAVENHHISLLLVPHTRGNTTLGKCKPGACLNVEFDYLTRIVAHQAELITKNYLKGSSLAASRE
ncbi:riboflavin synthase [Legionella londiniensis]|uniref:Riboflavin synthase n=1 Tax=Legionella londiniensis TaxID=45068 RepID=A0A0W0VS53_9GAMM|nr:riboflavin synthase [Legionella londiniensis]KTD22502.1 riboflavin synthase alpha chain [Legionella londiniensis]STX93345.1 riboflavin synthase alpha chain [Legionella londiniensis]